MLVLAVPLAELAELVVDAGAPAAATLSEPEIGADGGTGDIAATLSDPEIAADGGTGDITAAEPLPEGCSGMDSQALQGARQCGSSESATSSCLSR